MNFIKTPLSAGLYFVGVPIGTARDITLRALDVLASADTLAAEDTRSLRRLMDIHGVPLSGRKLIALHDHSKTDAVSSLVSRISSGESVAYASEAGMPLIADPGFELGQAVRDAGLNVTCAPGASAVVTALSLAGLPTDRFHFVGFLPNTSQARQAELSTLKDIRATLAFYESPKRLAAMLQDCSRVLGKTRHAAVCRELTKKFEEVQRGTLEDLAQQYSKVNPKGEIVVLVDRGDLEKVSEKEVSSDLSDAMLDHSMRDAVDIVAKAHDLPRRQVYQMALSMTKDKG